MNIIKSIFFISFLAVTSASFGEHRGLEGTNYIPSDHDHIDGGCTLGSLGPAYTHQLCNADGTYSTPICNNTINNQQWYIIKIKNAAQWKREIAKDRQEMGRDLESSEYPFYIVQSVEYKNNTQWLYTNVLCIQKRIYRNC